MASRSNPPKKPSGGRPNVRRFVSGESLSTTSTLSTADETELPYAQDTALAASPVPRKGAAQGQSPVICLETVKEVRGQSKPWMGKEFADSPSPSKERNEYLYDSSGSGFSTPATAALKHPSQAAPPIPVIASLKQNKPTPVSVPPRNTAASPPPLSPSKARWEQLRQHVLPSASKSQQGSSGTMSPTPSFTSFSQLNLATAGRPSTPKPSRLARFGFRQIVTEARELADDVTRKFADDILKACWFARYGEPTKPPKPDREPTQASLGSALHLPFMSSSSLPSSTTTGTSAAPSSERQGLRRPPSTVTLVPQTSRSNNLAALQTVIVRYASVSVNKETIYSFLPHEKEVLSVLLISFLSQSTGRLADEERRLSLEIFETVAKTWKPQLAEGEIDRCLWCCRAASMPPSPLRSRILLNLTTMLSGREPLLTTPIACRTLLPGLVFLVSFYSASSENSGSLKDNFDDLTSVRDLITNIFDGRCGQLDLEDLEQKYQELAMRSDLEDDLRRAICTEAILRCVDFATPKQQRIFLSTAEEFWEPSPSMHASPLRSKIHLNKLITFLRSALGFLLSASTVGSDIVFRLLTTRVLPELDIFKSYEQDTDLEHAKRLVIRLVLSLMSVDMESVENLQSVLSVSRLSEVKDLFLLWLNDDSSQWQECVKKELEDFAFSAEWSTMIRIAKNAPAALPMESRRVVVGLIIPRLQERMVSDPPPFKLDSLSDLLSSFAHIHPQMFYKPVFVCAGATKDATLVQQFLILLALAHYFPQFWIMDAEMVSIALMSDPTTTGGLGKGKAKEGQRPFWGKARPGQLLILLELIERLRSMRLIYLTNKDPNMTPDRSLAGLAKFIAALESRLSIWVDAKEQTILIPLSQRLLLASLFHEMRLITRSLKSAPWLQKMVYWTIHCGTDPRIGLMRWPSITEDCKDEIQLTFDRLSNVIRTACNVDKSGGQRKSMVPTPWKSQPEVLPDTFPTLAETRIKSLESIARHHCSSLLRALVAMSGALRPEDYTSLGPVVWDQCLDLADPELVMDACFVCMQCAEKSDTTFMLFLSEQMQSTDSSIRRQAVQRLGVLSGWRFQLLSLTFITDRTYRRPFKLARPPISFVPTDVGSSNYVRDDDYEELAGKHGHALPLDLRRRLSEIGWADDDKPIDKQLEWLRTPLSLLASTQLDQLSRTSEASEGYISDRNPSPGSSPGLTPLKSQGSESQLLRRNSSSGGQHSVKRRPVFVQPLVSVFLLLSDLAKDEDFAVSSLTRNILMDFMRDDPAVLCRPIIDILSGAIENIDTATLALRTFLHVRRLLPPRLSHHIFNHLAGFLKHLAKESTSPKSLRILACVVPVMARYASQVSEMSVRAIRRAKLEVFLFPSGLLWFPDSAPIGKMFPRFPERITNPFTDIPQDVMYMTMLRTSQNILFVDMLKQSPQDVHVVRKNWTRLVLPDIGIDTVDPLPRRTFRALMKSDSLNKVSLSFSRSHLLLVAQMFRTMTRHLNDRKELANLLDGVNRILIRHGDDIGVIAHVLIIYMVASTRFRRLMSSGSGFTLFLPSLMKVYCESGNNSAVREAIEYAFHRFFAVHEEVFVFQTLDVISTLVKQSDMEGDWIADNAYLLLSALKARQTDSQDSAGIRDANRAQEEETALAITADERPQVFLASLRKDAKTSEGLSTSISADRFDNKRFQPDNLVRMMLTVIAHDPTVRRAEYFLRVFRSFIPHLYNASGSTRNVIRDGIDALSSIILSKNTSKVKTPELGQNASTDASLANDAETDGQTASGRISVPCNPQAMRSDFLLLFASYVQAGGQPRLPTVQRSLEIAKAILKDTSIYPAAADSVRLFMGKVVQAFVVREDSDQLVLILKELAPVISAYGSSLDLTEFLANLATMSSNPYYANNSKFSGVISLICSSALDICESAFSLSTSFALPFRNVLIKLLTRAVSLLDSDVVAEIEKRDPSPGFVVAIVLPFIFSLRTTSELATETQWTDSWRQDAHALAWVRLLSYTMTACATGTETVGSIGRSSFSSPILDADDPNPEPARLEKKGRRRRPGQNAAVVAIRLAVALVALKAVVLRGEDDISSHFPGAWSRVGALVRRLLRDGNGVFAMQETHRQASPNSTPLASPIVSTYLDAQYVKEKPRHKRSSSSTSDAHLSLPPTMPVTDGRLSRSSSPTNDFAVRRPSPQTLTGPRLVDFMTWSLLEYVCLRRSPLTIQLRTFMHEKMHVLNETLVAQNDVAHFKHPSAVKARSLRPLSNVYSKPRYGMRNSAYSSAGPTPEGSPRLRPSDSGVPFGANFSSLTGVSNWSNATLDGTMKGPAPPSPPSPLSPTNLNTSFKKRIVHLGPATSSSMPVLSSSSLPISNSTTNSFSYPQLLGGSSKMDGITGRQSLAITRLRSTDLTRRTCERIRVVQSCMGYSRLLPTPAGCVAPISGRAGNVEASEPLGGRISASASPRGSILLEENSEPDLRAWSKRKACEQLMAEAEDLMFAWQSGFAMVASPSDVGGETGMMSAAASGEGDFDVTGSFAGGGTVR